VPQHFVGNRIIQDLFRFRIKTHFSAQPEGNQSDMACAG
jgi:hypothetical protein